MPKSMHDSRDNTEPSLVSYSSPLWLLALITMNTSMVMVMKDMTVDMDIMNIMATKVVTIVDTAATAATAVMINTIAMDMRNADTATMATTATTATTTATTTAIIIMAISTKRAIR
uniref:Uncharacterized protein n=1 Tax=Glossina austeni TaxID=7395 RepID=A0A1A9UTJ3_GLOAU